MKGKRRTMRTTVTARHCEIPDELKERAEDLLTKIAKIATRPQHAQVIFDADHGRKVVELHLSLTRGRVKIAADEADDFQSALDGAVHKLRSQLGKNAQRRPRRPATRSSTSSE